MSFSFPILPGGHLLAIQGLEPPHIGALLELAESYALLNRSGKTQRDLLRGRTLGTGPNPFLNVHAAAYRGVYDLADPDSSVFIIATGQSGHPLSRHYDDLGELWRRGEYIPMSLDPALARAAAEGVTRLVPAPEGGG